MNISTQVKGNSLVVKLRGELDMHSVPEFKDKIIDKMEDKGLNNLILNLKGVEFIDSSGLGAILGRYRYLNKKDGKVVLVNLKSQVQKVFALAGMLKIMPEYNDIETALKDLEKGGN